ncbi:uncharacterized protein [Zea mays]|uniref:Uncharacterized protein n=1 Tax=Zea mays TaxID=4577 RepID=C0PM69_MAIZE|nr:uncharacterized protein LOC100384170 [Zea mays]XP_008660631.2 uncharacterized protein LOC100384170 isoform X1 [Zea mays]XP_020400018.1 uncharacterized protein LOC100384170 isoform X1 [Zea mays]XP_020400019.1 uncharacterized protein LOC100384170 isoform X1 [Zea mays]ACN36285.1 unknown [Zea mays]|eukprot:NP_001170219.1 uncharacterized protein LOC100384170 [Zea mays]
MAVAGVRPCSSSSMVGASLAPLCPCSDGAPAPVSRPCSTTPGRFFLQLAPSRAPPIFFLISIAAHRQFSALELPWRSVAPISSRLQLARCPAPSSDPLRAHRIAFPWPRLLPIVASLVPCSAPEIPPMAGVWSLRSSGRTPWASRLLFPHAREFASVRSARSLPPNSAACFSPLLVTPSCSSSDLPHRRAFLSPLAVPGRTSLCSPSSSLPLCSIKCRIKNPSCRSSSL